MTTSPADPRLEHQLQEWREHLRRRQGIDAATLTALEDQLRGHVVRLVEGGLAPGEAFLIAVKRLGEGDHPARGFARAHAARLWRQLVTSGDATTRAAADTAREGVVAFALAVGAAVLIKLPALAGLDLTSAPSFYARNLSFFVLPLLTGFFAWKRRLDPATIGRLAAAFVAAAAFINVYPFIPDSDTEVLAALHLPIALWLAVGMAHAGGRWSEVSGRMDFIRFSGELVVYFVLIGLGGGVLTGMMALIFGAIGVDLEPFFESWMLPCGAAGAVLIAAWLVESRQGVMDNIAPVLTRLFTPLFAAGLLAFLGAVLVTGRGVGIDRDVLIGFDLVLALVVCLLLYSISARDPHAPPGAFDALQLLLVVAALLVDVVALWAIAARIGEFGLTPNRVAALGENVILLANLGWSAVLSSRFLRGRGSVAALEAWQTRFLPVYAGWAAIVVVVFPFLFGWAG